MGIPKPWSVSAEIFMEEKVVCYYCATVYNADEECCPLCRSTKRAEDAVVPQRPRRERLTEQERKRKTVSRGGRYASKSQSNASRKPLMIAALVFLILAVLALFWFIADMIGWLPGAEDGVDRETLPSVSVNNVCTELLPEPKRLLFTEIGETLQLSISVNAGCEEVVYCNSADPIIASVSGEAVTTEGETYKSVVFTITALAEGNTAINISCGSHNVACPVEVNTNAQPTESVPAVDPNFTPELTRLEVKFTEPGETVQLKVTNLPENAEVIWRSQDETVVTVDSNGLATAVAGGETTIVCEVLGATAQVAVTCEMEAPTETTDNAAAHLERGRTDVSVEVGDSFPLYLYNSEGEHIDDITYVVDNTAVCVVEDNHVKVVGRGTTTVRVIYNDQEFTCIVRAS